jgi:hypothetical protein
VRISDFSRYALSICAAAAFLAGCGGSQPPIGAPGAMLQSRSLVLPTAHGRDLLYVSGYFASNVYTYPAGTLISGLAGGMTGVCSNAAGDVFMTVPNANIIDEFAHGRSTPIAQLSDPFGSPQSCSVDPTTGKLAVVSSNGVAIYRPGTLHRWRLPRLYTPGQNLSSCGYDASGDLFIDGETGSSVIIFAELPKGASKFENITLDQKLTVPGTVQWDGQYLAVGDQYNTLIRRFSIQGSQGTQIGSVTLSGTQGIPQFWIQDTIVIGPDEFNAQIGFWKYPDGGSEIKTLQMDLPYGATVSVVRK